jgi:hypothetical protein
MHLEKDLRRQTLFNFRLHFMEFSLAESEFLLQALHDSFASDVTSCSTATTVGSKEMAMTPIISPQPDSGNDIDLSRRHFLERVAIASAAAAVLWPGSASAVMELWEEGDPLCSVRYDPLPKPDGYDLDLAYLESFISVSKSLTGIDGLDRHLANQYMERFATHPQLSKNLNLLVQAYRAIPGGKPGENEVRQSILMSSDAAVRAGAKQLIYLWYISAFFIPLDITPGPKPPLQDDPSDTRKKIWVYGTPEQYGRGMIWQVIQAHAPMMPGGPPQYWANRPAV